MERKDISQIDQNFKVPTKLDKKDIRFRDVLEAPFFVHGVFWQDGKYRRIPEAVAQAVSPNVLALHANTAGGRVRFRTDSVYIAIHAEMPSIGKMPHFALTGSAGFDLYADGRYVKTFVPPFGITDGYESLIDLGEPKMREITIHFPLYSDVSRLYIGLQAQARVEEPKPYRVKTPMVYYGSSITQGGCASRPGNAYENTVSRWLDADHINLGFSGSAKAEDPMIEYVSGLGMSAFILDYDHNAPTVEHLERTHEKMFLAVRQKHPQIPVLIMSRPKYSLDGEEKLRLTIIRKTYDNAIARGDENVYFLDGPELMALAEDEGTVDNAHPNDLGFASMARAVAEKFKGISLL